MKKVLFILGLVVVLVSLQSCTDESEQVQENAKFQKKRAIHKAIDPEKDCPPNDRNCNGVPDNQE